LLFNLDNESALETIKIAFELYAELQRKTYFVSG